MRVIITAETNADKRPAYLPEDELTDLLRRYGLRLVSVERQMLPLLFVGWQRRGGHWHAIAAGIDKASVKHAVEGIEGVVILPLGCTP
jgi:hypothetical protein